MASVDVALDTLATLTARIYESASRAVLEIGEALEEGRALLGKQGYEEWVESELPFTLDTARRYVAIHRAYRELPETVLDRLPRPWQAMYALVSVGAAELTRMVDTQCVTPTTTIREARTLARKYKADRWTGSPNAGEVTLPSDADLMAGRLMHYDPSELSPRVRLSLESWLG